MPIRFIPNPVDIQIGKDNHTETQFHGRLRQTLCVRDSLHGHCENHGVDGMPEQVLPQVFCSSQKRDILDFSFGQHWFDFKAPDYLTALQPIRLSDKLLRTRFGTDYKHALDIIGMQSVGAAKKKHQSADSPESEKYKKQKARTIKRLTLLA